MNRALTNDYTVQDKKGESKADVQRFRYSEERIQIAEVTLVTILLCLLQVFPILTLTFLKPQWAKLLVVSLMIVLMSIVNVVFANASRSTNFASVAT
jgi:hypothetical protein